MKTKIREEWSNGLLHQQHQTCPVLHRTPHRMVHLESKQHGLQQPEGTGVTGVHRLWCTGHSVQRGCNQVGAVHRAPVITGVAPDTRHPTGPMHRSYTVLQWSAVRSLMASFGKGTRLVRCLRKKMLRFPTSSFGMGAINTCSNRPFEGWKS